jgi:hypothetical protein
MMGMPVNHNIEGGSYTQEIRAENPDPERFITELRRN